MNDHWNAITEHLDMLHDTQEFQIMTKDMNEEEREKALFMALLNGKKILVGQLKDD